MRTIPEYNNYSITEEGKLYRKLKNGNIKEVRGRQNKSGYVQVTLSDKERRQERLLHRLVAEAFIPNPETKPQVDHIDEDKTNNSMTNLRWATAKENNTYYHTKDGRAHYIKLAQKRKNQLKAYATELRKERLEVTTLKKELTKERTQHVKANERQEKKIAQLRSKLEQERIRFEEYITKEHAKVITAKQNYQGYKDATGVKFGDVKTMVEATGKQITVQGQLFPSCGAAASWIVEQEANIGTVRNKDTISKELRRYLQGRRGAWVMYDRYDIGS